MVIINKYSWSYILFTSLSFCLKLGELGVGSILLRNPAFLMKSQSYGTSPDAICSARLHTSSTFWYNISNELSNPNKCALTINIHVHKRSH